MRVITDLSKFDRSKFPDIVVALGNFDGVHQAHRKLLELVKSRSEALYGIASVLTFKEHPQRVLHKKEDPPILTSYEHKLHLLRECGIQLCFVIDFSIEFARLSAEDFVSKVLVDMLGAKEICLGFNARFGHDRTGDSCLMKSLAEKERIGFLEAPPIRIGREVVSSTLIRKMILAGDFEQAQKMLGRPYSFFGQAVQGHGRGRRLGFPTINLDVHSEVLPPQGVYAVWAEVVRCQFTELREGVQEFSSGTTKRKLKAVMNYGVRPTFENDSLPIPEIHFLDAYSHEDGKNLFEITFGRWLRSEKRFENEAALKRQIEHDIQSADDWFEHEKSKGGVNLCR